MIRSSKPMKNNQGSILIVTLWIVALLSLLALALAGRSRLAIRQTDWVEQEAVAQLVMQALAERCVQVIKNDDPEVDSYAEPWGQVFVLTGDELARELGINSPWLEGLEARITPVDECGKLNINYFAGLPDLLEACINEATVDANAKILTENIIGWWDQDFDGIGENDTYPAYNVMNGDFRFIEELLFVDGVMPLLFWGEDSNHNQVLDSEEDDGDLFLPLDNSDGVLQPGLSEVLTIHQNENFELNINGVSEPVFRAVLSGVFEGSEVIDLSNRFFEYRRGNDGLDGTEDDKFFESPGDLLQAKLTQDELGQLNTSSDVDWVTHSSAFRFYLDIRFSGIPVTKRSSIVISRIEGEVRVLEWHEE